MEKEEMQTGFIKEYAKKWKNEYGKDGWWPSPVQPCSLQGLYPHTGQLLPAARESETLTGSSSPDTKISNKPKMLLRWPATKKQHIQLKKGILSVGSFSLLPSRDQCKTKGREKMAPKKKKKPHFWKVLIRRKRWRWIHTGVRHYILSWDSRRDKDML